MKKLGSALFVAGIFWALFLSGCTTETEPSGPPEPGGNEISLQGVYEVSDIQVAEDSTIYRAVLRMTLVSGKYEQVEYDYLKTHPARTGEWNALVYMSRATGTYTVTHDSLMTYQLSVGSLSDYDSAALTLADTVKIKMKSFPSYGGVTRFRNLTDTSIEFGRADGSAWYPWVKH